MADQDAQSIVDSLLAHIKEWQKQYKPNSDRPPAEFYGNKLFQQPPVNDPGFTMNPGALQQPNPLQAQMNRQPQAPPPMGQMRPQPMPDTAKTNPYFGQNLQQVLMNMLGRQTQ